MSTTSPFPLHERALVLGGGGSTGNAWLIGVVAGLFDAGLDVSRADLIIGTSAGATAAAQITGANPPDLFAATIAAAPPAPRGPAGPAPGPSGSVADHLARMDRIIAVAADAADMRRTMGRIAIERAAADPTQQNRWRATVAHRLPSQNWPEQTVGITVVDAESGEPVVLDRDSGVELVDAVAASTAGGPAYRIGDRWYVDGGYRSVENADLAAGTEHVDLRGQVGAPRLRMPRGTTER